MAAKDPRVDAYIAKAPTFAKPILQRFRKAVHAACPEVTESIKWRVPNFGYKGMLCGMAAFKGHCSLGFWKASLMQTVPGDKPGGMGHFGRIASISETRTARALVRMVKEAVALNDAAVKVPRAMKPRKASARTPADLTAALGRSRKAAERFNALGPSHKREYIEWITDAKTDETRRRRLETALAWIAEGKNRNWKYER